MMWRALWLVALVGCGSATPPECVDGETTAEESCNGVDDDCDGIVDDGVGQRFYADADSDGFGDPGAMQIACTAPPGAVVDATDCDDHAGDVFPGAPELCDAIDDDCDGGIDDGVSVTWFRDNDQDGFGDDATTRLQCSAPAGFAPVGGDCDDEDAAVAPGAIEWCDDVDQDCDGAVDDPDAADTLTLHGDGDGDGFGDAVAFTSCDAADGVADGSDCDDGDASVSPAAMDTPYDGIDSDCSGGSDDDADGDGQDAVAAGGTDCDDTRAEVFLGATERYYDGVDGACDGGDDDDADGDGFAASAAGGTDCNDTDAAHRPGRIWTVPGDFATLQAALWGLCEGEILEIGPGVWAGPLDASSDEIEVRGAGSDATVIYDTDGLRTVSMRGRLSGVSITGDTRTALSISGDDTVVDDVQVLSSGYVAISGASSVSITDLTSIGAAASIYSGGDLWIDGLDVDSPADTFGIEGADVVASNIHMSGSSVEDFVVEFEGADCALSAVSAQTIELDLICDTGSLSGFTGDGAFLNVSSEAAVDTVRMRGGEAYVRSATSLRDAELVDGDGISIWGATEVDGLVVLRSSGNGITLGTSGFYEPWLRSVASIGSADTGIAMTTGATVECSISAFSGDYGYSGSTTLLADSFSYANRLAYASAPPASGGNSITDPQFVSASATLAFFGAEDLHLRATSPARDHCVGSDVDGTVRDAGAYGGPYRDGSAYEVDADGDGMFDGWELAHGLDPTVADPYGDLDGDTVYNIDEFDSGMWPERPDTDADGVIDPLDPDPLNG